MHDFSSHLNQAIHKIHATLKHFFKEKDATPCLGREHDGHAHQVGREGGPDAVFNFGYDEPEIIANGETPPCRQHPVSTVHFPVDPKPTEAMLQHGQYALLVHAFDRQASTRSRGRCEITACFDIIGGDAMGNSPHAPDPKNGQKVCANSFNTCSHFIEQVTEVLHMRLTCGVENGRLSPGTRGRHDDIFRCGYTGFVQQHVGSAELFAREHVGDATL